MHADKDQKVLKHEIWAKKKTTEIMLELPGLGSGEKITLVQMLEYMRGRAFGMVMVLMSVLSLIPNLFGHTIATGIIVIPLSLLILIPFPLSNIIPAFAILILSLGLIEKDGVIVLIGILISTSAIVLISEILDKVLQW